MARSLLEYVVKFWSPSVRTDIGLLIKVQHRAIKSIPGFSGFSYDESLISLNMCYLARRLEKI